MQPQRLEPQEGQESVWDYPRPPVTDPTDALITVAFGDHEIVRTTSAIRVLETSQPPAFYIPRDHVDMSMLEPCIGRSFCEWKGDATYFDLLSERRPNRTSCLDLRIPKSSLWSHHRVPGVLRPKGRLRRRRRAGGTERGQLLRRLDHLPSRRAVQRQPRLKLVVNQPARRTPLKPLYICGAFRVASSSGRAGDF